jgi:hypothetical protein
MRASPALILCLCLSASLGVAACKREAAAPVVHAPAETPSGDVGEISTSRSGQGLKLRLPPAKVAAAGRTASVSLPFRTSDGYSWAAVSPTPPPWRLASSRVERGAGPEGTDLAVFSFAAAEPGTSTLKFTLAATGGGGEPIITYSASVRAK